MARNRMLPKASVRNKLVSTIEPEKSFCKAGRTCFHALFAFQVLAREKMREKQQYCEPNMGGCKCQWLNKLLVALNPLLTTSYRLAEEQDGTLSQWVLFSMFPSSSQVFILAISRHLFAKLPSDDFCASAGTMLRFFMGMRGSSLLRNMKMVVVFPAAATPIWGNVPQRQSNLPLACFFYQNHHWRIYDDSLRMEAPSIQG